MKKFNWYMGFLVVLAVLSQGSCSLNGVKVDHINTEPKGQVEDHTTNNAIPAPDAVVPPETKYPDKRDWPAKWDQWHRYYNAVQCSFKGDYTECEYYLCGEGVFTDPLYRGSHLNKRKKLFNRYYYTHCYTTKGQKLPSQKSASVKNQLIAER